MATNGLIAHRGAQLIGRQDLQVLPTPVGTETHRPIPHSEVVHAVIETLGFRSIDVLEDQYAVTPDGMRMFGVLAITLEATGVRLVIGLRNSHDKSFSLAFTVGYRVFVCDNLAFYGDFSPVMKKHSKRLDFVEVIDSAVSRMQRHFEPMRRQIDVWRQHALPDTQAKLLIYEAFVEGRLKAPRHLARMVHDEYFNPKFPDFEPRTIWSLSNAFTSAFKTLEPVSQFTATARLSTFLRGRE
jgi:uncharacterized protein DUF932